MTKDRRMTWEDLKALEQGTVLADYFEDNVRILVMRGPASLCAYLGVPMSHPLAGFSYEEVPLEVHGGLTFAGSGESWPADFYWYGWDYAHSGDLYFFEEADEYPNDKPWLLDDVKREAELAVYDFIKFMNLAEKCYRKGQGWRVGE